MPPPATGRSVVRRVTPAAAPIAVMMMMMMLVVVVRPPSFSSSAAAVSTDTSPRAASPRRRRRLSVTVLHSDNWLSGHFCMSLLGREWRWREEFQVVFPIVFHCANISFTSLAAHRARPSLFLYEDFPSPSPSSSASLILGSRK